MIEGILDTAPFERLIQRVVRRYTEDAPVDVSAIARDLGLAVIHDETMGSDVVGSITKESRSPSGYVIRLNAKDAARRRRFTLAHMIAHYVLQRDIIGNGLIDSAAYQSCLGSFFERDANRYAADLLIPRAILKGMFRGGMTNTAKLAAAFNVSEAAIQIRLEELKLVQVETGTLQ